MRKYLLLPAMAMALTANPALAQNAVQEEKTNEGSVQSVELSAAELVETKNTMSVITQEVMERKNADNLSEALRMEPGIQMFGNTGMFRGSSYINIRGFGEGRIGMFLDGIPLAMHWGREFDFARISTWDVNSIEISKGYSSPLLGGTNSMGGVIDLRTAKPEKPFEFKAMYKNQFDREVDDMGREFGTTIGTRQDNFYLKASYYNKKQDFFTPSAKAVPVPGDRKGERRSRTGHEDEQLNLMAGWTPTENVDIMLGYFWHDAEKNSSQSWGAAGSPDARRYYWPDWNTERVYLTANVTIDEQSYFKGTLYFDKHEDTLYAWRNDAMDHSFASGFDDKGWGTHLEYGYLFNERHKLALAGNYRSDTHERTTVDGRVKMEDMEGFTYDVGAEYTYKPMDPLTMTFGLSYIYKEGQSYDRTDVNASGVIQYPGKYSAANNPKNDALNWQFGAFYNLTPEHEVHFTYARKTSLPSYKQMYEGARYRTYLGNSSIRKAEEIDPEMADHFELGYKGDIDGWLQLSANIFYSRVRDVIATNPDYNSSDPSTRLYANIGQAAFSGYELALQAEATDWLTLGGNLSYIKTYRKNQLTKTQADDGVNNWIVDKPKFMASAYLVITPFEEWRIIPSLQAVDARYDLAGVKILPGFARVDIKTTYDLTENIMLQAGVENIGDVDYGYSHAANTNSGTYVDNRRDNQPGRNYYLGLTYTY